MSSHVSIHPNNYDLSLQIAIVQLYMDLGGKQLISCNFVFLEYVIYMTPLRNIQNNLSQSFKLTIEIFGHILLFNSDHWICTILN